MTNALRAFIIKELHLLILVVERIFMLSLLKYLKHSVVPILIIILLLVVQAVCDLKLPDYTSTIVNNGIQNGGIVDSVPIVIRGSTLKQLQLFMSAEDTVTVQNNYTLISKDTMSEKEYEKDIKRYPDAEQEEVYIKNDTSDKVYDELNQAFGRAFVALSLLEQNPKQLETIKQQILSGLPADQQEEASQMPMISFLSQLPQSTLQEINKSMASKLDQLPDTYISQGAAPAIREEYKVIGINTDRMQFWYMIKEGLQMVLVALISLASVVLVTVIAARVAANLGRNLRSNMFSKVLAFSNWELDQFSTASLITRTTNDIQQVQLLLPMLLRIVFYAPIIAIGGILKVARSQKSMLWVIALAVGAIFLVVGFLFVVVLPKMKKMQSVIDRLNQVTREILSGLWVIRAFSTQRHEEERFDGANQSLMRLNLFINRVMSCMFPLMMFIMNAIAILVVWVGAHGVNDGTMQVGNMMAVIQYTMQIILAFLLISMISIMLPRATVSAKRIEEVLNAPLNLKDPRQPQEFIRRRRGYVEFREVSFRYPHAEEDVLHDISFVARPGETTAIIGSTGSGKSTLVNLIPRFYDVTGGEILVDGVDVRNVTQRRLRNLIGYVPQKGVLFSGTIESNIKYGEPDLSDTRMRKAANVAQAKEFILEKPDQYLDPITQGGGNVSGGQKQRLSIARAVAKDPEIYIFDDSFSALDYRTDAKLRAALKKYTKSGTVIIVAQRISTILDAEQIIVLDQGKIVGKGTHKDLLKDCEVYYEIAASQLSEEELKS